MIVLYKLTKTVNILLPDFLRLKERLMLAFLNKSVILSLVCKCKIDSQETVRLSWISIHFLETTSPSHGRVLMLTMRGKNNVMMLWIWIPVVSNNDNNNHNNCNNNNNNNTRCIQWM